MHDAGFVCKPLFCLFKNSILHFRMRIFFLEERLAGKGGAKVRKWRSNDGINYDQLMKIKITMKTSHGSLSVNMFYITLEFQPKVRESLLNI